MARGGAGARGRCLHERNDCTAHGPECEVAHVRKPSGAATTLKSPMEASPDTPSTPHRQLPLGDGSASVRALGDRIVIEGLTVADERAAKVVRERAEAGTPAAETVAKAIEIGTRVIDSEGDGDERRLRPARLRGARRQAQRGPQRHPRGGQRRDRQAHRRELRHRARRLGPGRDQADAGDGDPAPAAGAAEAADRRGREQPARRRRRCAPRRRCSRPRSAIARSSPSSARATRKENRALHAQVRELTERVSVQLERNEGEQRVAEAEEAGHAEGLQLRGGRLRRRLRGSRRTRRLRHPHRRRGRRGRRQEGRRPGRARRRRRPGGGPDRLRGQGQEALQERGLEGAQRGDGGARRLLRRPRRRRRGAGPRRSRAAPRVRGQQADRRGRPRGARLASRSRVAYRLAAARVSMARDRDLTVDAAEVRAVDRGGDLVPQAGAGDPLGADRHQDLLRQGQDRPRRDGRRRSRRSSSGSTRSSPRPTPPAVPRADPGYQTGCEHGRGRAAAGDVKPERPIVRSSSARVQRRTFSTPSAPSRAMPQR